MRIFRLVLILVTVVLPAADVQEANAHETASVEKFPTMSSALDAIGAKYQVAIGFEYLTGDQDRVPVNLDLSSAEIRTVLDKLVSQRVEYTWKVEGGVYDIYPKQASDSLLDVTIQRFAVNGATPREISAAIDHLPEVKQWLDTHGVRRNEIETGSRWSPSDRRASLTVTGTSLRALLNRVIQLTGRPSWTVVRYGEHLEFIAIYI